MMKKMRNTTAKMDHIRYDVEKYVTSTNHEANQDLLTDDPTDQLINMVTLV